MNTELFFDCFKDQPAYFTICLGHDDFEQLEGAIVDWDQQKDCLVIEDINQGRWRLPAEDIVGVICK